MNEFAMFDNVCIVWIRVAERLYRRHWPRYGMVMRLVRFLYFGDVLTGVDCGGRMEGSSAGRGTRKIVKEFVKWQEAMHEEVF